MKAACLIIVATIPAAAFAAASPPEVDARALRAAVPLTEVLDEDVRTPDGRDFGEIEDVMLNDDGSVAYYKVEPEMDVYEDFAELMAEARDAELERTPVGAGNDDEERDDDAIRIDPGNIRFNEHGEAVISDLDRREVFSRSLALGEEGKTSLIAASKLLEREVELMDEESFGSVEDVMLSRDGSKAVALIVDNWEGLNKHRRALPMPRDNAGFERVRYELTEEEVRKVGDFDLEAHIDQL